LALSASITSEEGAAVAEEPAAGPDEPTAASASAPGIASLAAAPRALRFAALRVPTFRWYWTLSALSGMGDSMENVLRDWLVWSLTHSVFWLGMMVFAHWVPFTFFSLYGGVLADRYDNRKVQIVSQLLLFGAAAGVAAATLVGFVTVWWIVALLLVHGFAGAIGGPAQQTLIHSIVGRDRLVSAVSLNSAIRQVAQVAGPVIAGVILIVFGAGWGFLVNALTFLPLLAMLAIMRVRPLGERSRQAIPTALREGLGFIRARPRLVALIGIEMLPTIFLGGAFTSLLPAFATDVLHGGAIHYALLLAASGAGALIAVLYLAYARTPRSVGLVILGAAAAQVTAILLFALSTAYLLSAALMVIVGLCAVITQTYNNTTLQLSAPDALRGRVMGAYSFGAQGVRVVNGPLLGTLAALVGAPVAVAGSAAVVLASLLAILARVRAIRGRG